MKKLLTITAIIEAGTGVGLLAAPTIVARLLLGGTVDTPAALTVARVGGMALLAISVACWLSRENGRALVIAILLYNVVVVGLLVDARLLFRAPVYGRLLLFTLRLRSGGWRACGGSGWAELVPLYTRLPRHVPGYPASRGLLTSRVARRELAASLLIGL